MSGSQKKTNTTLQLVVYNPGLPGTETKYFSSIGFTTKATDTPATTFFDGRMLYQPNIRRTAFSDARVMGGAEVAAGEIALNNEDQALSYLLGYGVNGRDATIYIGDLSAAYPASHTAWMKGTVDQVECDIDKLTLRLRDRLQALKLPFQSTRFAGTNSGSPLTGAEGVADISGKVKPVAYGRCRHVPAIMVNTSKLTYCVSDGAVNAIDAVYDQGVALTPGADFANLAALEAAVPGAGTFITCLALGLFRLQAAAAGRVTADVRGSSTGGYVNKVGDIINRILIDRCGYVSGDIDSTALAALNTAAPQEVGVWVGEETDRASVINKLLNSVGAWLSTNRSGLWTMAQLVAPSGVAAATIKNSDILSIERIATRDPGAGVPAWRVVVNYKPYYAKFQRSELAAGVTEANKSDFVQERRTSYYETASVKTTYPFATKLEFDTQLESATDALAEATRKQTLHGVRRDTVRVKVPFVTDFSSIDLGSRVDVVTNLLGYGAGRSFVCIGIGSDGQTIEMDLWG